MKRLLYTFLVLVNSILLVAGVIGTIALATYLVLKELAVMRRTNCKSDALPGWQHGRIPDLRRRCDHLRDPCPLYT